VPRRLQELSAEKLFSSEITRWLVHEEWRRKSSVVFLITFQILEYWSVDAVFLRSMVENKKQRYSQGRSMERWALNSRNFMNLEPIPLLDVGKQ